MDHQPCKPPPPNQKSTLNQFISARTPSVNKTRLWLCARPISRTRPPLLVSTSDTYVKRSWMKLLHTNHGLEWNKNSSYLSELEPPTNGLSDGPLMDSHILKEDIIVQLEIITLLEELLLKLDWDVSWAQDWESVELTVRLPPVNGSIKSESLKEWNAEITCGWVDSSSPDSEKSSVLPLILTPNQSKVTGMDQDATWTSPLKKPEEKVDYNIFLRNAWRS